MFRASFSFLTLLSFRCVVDGFAAINNDWERISANLPPLGKCPSALKGEEAEVGRRKDRGTGTASDKYNKPDAQVRLFCFYGVADSAVSMRKWVTTAPPWLETRVVELPGHGYLTDGLPSCSNQVSAPLSVRKIAEQRHDFVKSLADQVEPLLINESGQCVPYSFYGFSLGALNAYLLCQELKKRRLPPPVALFACGRGAPHAIPYCTELQRNMQLWDDEQMLEYVETKLGLLTSNIQENRRKRMASLFRCGMLFSCIHAGEESISNESQDLGGSVDILWDEDDKPVPFADDAPILNCSVVSITGSQDTTWPPKLVERWCDVSGASHRHYCLDQAHTQLMNSEESRKVVFDELAHFVVKCKLESS